MAAADAFRRAVARQAIPAELAQCLEQPVPRFVEVDDLHHRVVDESEEQIRRVAVDRAHAVDGGQVEAAGEDREPVEQALLVRAQQVVGPGDHVVQVLVALVGVARPGVEQAESVVEPFDHRLQPERPGAHGGELDREGKAVEATAEAGQCRQRFGVGSNPDRAAAARSQNNCTAGESARSASSDSSATTNGATV